MNSRAPETPGLSYIQALKSPDYSSIAIDALSLPNDSVPLIVTTLASGGNASTMLSTVYMFCPSLS
jgi:hypothetical protein